jgi:long-chain fatty acid transport protein
LKFKFQLLALLFFPLASLAGGFQIYEQGNPAIGTANVGQAAFANDASTAYFNPAGMTQLCDSQMLLGSQFVATNSQFAPNNNTTFSGNNGGQAGSLLPAGGIYDVFSFSPDLRFGMSVTGPYAGFLNYNNGWVGRYFVQDTLLITVNINPAIAYRINPWLSVGAGASLEYSRLNETIGIFRPFFPNDDGQADLKLENYAPGFNLGILLTPSEFTRIGIAYRSKITHDLKGDIAFLRLDATPAVSSEIIEPQNVIASIYHDVTEKLTLLGEVGWADWSVFQNTPINIRGITLSVPRNWKNTYRVGGGVEYKFFPNLQWQSGISYDTSPTNAADRLPDLPVDRQIRVGTGIIYTTKKNVRLGLQTEYVNFGKSEINHITRIGTLSGDYSNNYAVILAANVNFDL